MIIPDTIMDNKSEYTVNEIGEFVFQYKSSLRKLMLPDTLKKLIILLLCIVILHKIYTLYYVKFKCPKQQRGVTIIKNKIETTKEFALENIITTTAQFPGIKVNRNKFLAVIFASEKITIQDVLDCGPIQTDFPRDRLSYIANKLIIKRTSQS